MGPLPASAIGLHLTIIDLDQMAAELLRSTFHRFAKVGVQSDYSGAQDAQAVMERAGVRGVWIKRHQGFLSDHFDHLAKAHRRGGVSAHHPAHGIQCFQPGAGCRRPHLRGGRGGIPAAADRSGAASTQVTLQIRSG